jgi:hypothetical protein
MCSERIDDLSNATDHGRPRQDGYSNDAGRKWGHHRDDPEYDDEHTKDNGPS